MNKENNRTAFDREVTLALVKQKAERKENEAKGEGPFRRWVKKTASKFSFRKAMLATVFTVAGYAALGWTTGRVNNELIDFTPPEKGSAVVEWLKLSINRELKTGWGPSGTILRPSHIRVDMCAFQNGQRLIWQRVAEQLETHITRASESQQLNPDISDVRYRLRLGDHWSPLFLLDSKLSTTSSFSVAVDKLDHFQKKMAKPEGKDKAVMYPRIDNLSYLVGDVTHVLGDGQARLRVVAGKAGMTVGPETRRVTYEVLGIMNASCGLLKSVQYDFGKVVEYQSIADTFPLTVERVCDSIHEYPPVLNNMGGQVAQLDADVSVATNQLEALQRALAAEARQALPTHSLR